MPAVDGSPHDRNDELPAVSTPVKASPRLCSLENLMCARQSPPAVALSNDSADTIGLTDTSTQDRKLKRKRNPNWARNHRKTEIQGLQQKVGELGAYLATLRRAVCEAKDGCGVWEEVCRDQKLQRAQTAQENARLRRLVGEYAQEISTLRHLMHKSTRTMNMQAVRANLTYAFPVTLDSESTVFDSMMAELDVVYGEIDRLLDTNGIAGSKLDSRSGFRYHGKGASRWLDSYLNDCLPFDMDSTSTIVWSVYSGTSKHCGGVYFKDTKKIDSSDTIVESFALDLKTTYAHADFRYHQVMKRYVEEGRVVIAWIAVAEPVELANKSFTNCGYKSRGFIMCEPLNTSANWDNSPFTRVRRCQRVQPFIADRSPQARSRMNTSSSAVLEFVVSLNNARTHLQQFQNKLLQQSLDERKATQS